MDQSQTEARLDESQVVGTSFVVSVSDVTLNFIVSLLTGSIVMLSQALQGLSDMTTAGILYLGVRRSKRAHDTAHPLGYGREIFFWALIAAITMFMGTGLLSLYFGLQQLREPEPLELSGLALAMLSFGLVTNLFAFSRSVKRLNQIDSPTSWWHRIANSGMVETKTTFTVDLMGTLAALFGFVAMSAYIVSGDARLDGIGAMVIGISTMAAAIFIITDVHGLIVGRAVSPEIAERITDAALSVNEVNQVVDLYTLYIGSDRLLVIVEVNLLDGLSTRKIERIMDEVKKRIHEAVPAAHRIQVEVESQEEELTTS